MEDLGLGFERGSEVMEKFCVMKKEAYTVCPTCYRTRHFFNNSNTNDDIATKFEQECVRCVRNEAECVPTRYMKNLFIHRRLVFGGGCTGGA